MQIHMKNIYHQALINVNLFGLESNRHCHMRLGFYHLKKGVKLL